MNFTARQLQEKCQTQHRHRFTSFIDLTKSFDTICREGLWNITAKYGIPERFIAIVKSFHEGMVARGLDERERVVINMSVHKYRQTRLRAGSHTLHYGVLCHGENCISKRLHGHPLSQ